VVTFYLASFTTGPSCLVLEGGHRRKVRAWPHYGRRGCVGDAASNFAALKEALDTRLAADGLGHGTLRRSVWEYVELAV